LDDGNTAPKYTPSTERDETELQDINNGLDVGLRLALYPLEFLGVEGELGYAPLSTEDDESAAWIMYRAHVLGQLPGSSITPFFVLGTGFISSRSDSLGNDTDQAYHFGLGVKAAMSRRSVIRLDVRDNISNKRSGESFPHNLEVLLGVSFVFGAKEPPPPPTDMDGDGFMDNEDDCPDEAGIAPDGCPPEDTDGDGITDDADACPEEAGIAPDGCPDKDSDKDGIPVPDDKCPEEAGIAPDGCPDKDSDKDGIPVPDDRCPDQPETVNGYQDADGCPDTVPEKIQKFDGVLEGIEFASGKSTIRNASKPKLDEAAAVMVEFPSVKILIIGHTDDQGKAADNKKLSEERARAVRDYLASKGVDAGRIAVRGEGEDKPRDTNKTAAGRARNRRIEFQILKR
ncbi:MAG: OmpA family protein, partial [Myxococcota bacterium]